MLHVDVMDGHFVPNLTIGPPVVKRLRRAHRPLPRLPPDDRRTRATISRRSEGGRRRLLGPRRGRGHGRADRAARARSVSSRPGREPRDTVRSRVPYLDAIDLLLIMTVHPGFGGQSFIAEVLPKIDARPAVIDGSASQVALQVDGGIDERTAPRRRCRRCRRVRRRQRHLRPAPTRLPRPTRSARRLARLARSSAAGAKVLTVSDGVGGRHPGGQVGRGARGALAAAGFDVVEHAWSPTASTPVADALAGWPRLRRPRRHHGRHRLRSARRHPEGTGGHRPRGARPGRGHASASTRSAAVAGRRRHARPGAHPQHARLDRAAPSSASTPSSTSCPTPSTC